jgi:hypothetical protein
LEQIERLHRQRGRIPLIQEIRDALGGGGSDLISICRREYAAKVAGQEREAVPVVEAEDRGAEHAKLVAENQALKDRLAQRDAALDHLQGMVRELIAQSRQREEGFRLAAVEHRAAMHRIGLHKDTQSCEGQPPSNLHNNV